MAGVKNWDVIVIGGGLIGVSLALALRKQGAAVLILERGEPGREASYAAAGMLAHCDPHTPALLRPLAAASAKIYPEFIQEIEEESGEHIDFRCEGTIMLLPTAAGATPEAGGPQPIPCPDIKILDQDEIAAAEPALNCEQCPAVYLPEAAVDPRQLTRAVLAAARHRGVEVASGITANEVLVSNQRAVGVQTARARYLAPTVVNCAGAWAGQIAPPLPPTRPVKGHMLALAVPISYDQHGTPKSPHILRHVIRTPDVYLVPRSDGRIIIGSTLEEAGFDKRVDVATIKHLHEAAMAWVPQARQARILESWTGLRPGTPDNLPILGATPITGYFMATGHYRDGILLAPITAQIMAQVIGGAKPELDISAFAPGRFAEPVNTEETKSA
jgi:glycine oxidase